MVAAMFEGWDAVALARAQFASRCRFHIVFPAFSIGLASYIWRCWKRYGFDRARGSSSIVFNYWLRSSRSGSAWAWFRAS